MFTFKKSKITTSVCVALCLSALVSVQATDASESTETTVTTDVSETFETATVFPFTAWTGYGSLIEATYTAPAPAGCPIASGDHTKVLNVDGYVNLASSMTDQSNGGAVVDMMVKVAFPDEDLALPTDEIADGAAAIQIATGIEKDGTLKVYAGSTPSWIATNSKYNEGDWIRISFNFDYVKDFCQVLVNGEPVYAAAVNGVGGYAKAGDETATGGSWFKLASNSSLKKVASVKVIGTTSIDDMVVKAGVPEFDILAEAGDYENKLDNPVNVVSSGTEGETEIKVSKQWLTDMGIPWTSDALNAKLDGSGLTVAQKYAAGLNPVDGLTLKLNDMVVESGALKIQCPVLTPGYGFKNVVHVQTTTETKQLEIVDGKATVDLTHMGNGNVLKYKLVTVKNSAN